MNAPILTEYEEVLARKEFSVKQNEAIRVLEFVHFYALHIPYVPQKANVPDVDDLAFILCARQGKADALITGNKKHFPPSLCQGFEVLSPADFISNLKLT